jgi:hypothetical protein
MTDFVFVQSWMIYYVSIIESLLITPYYYIILQDKVFFNQTIFTLCLILTVISAIILILLKTSFDFPIFIFLFYVTNVFKRLSINKNISNMNPIKNLKNSLVYFFLFFLMVLLLILKITSINIFLVLTILNMIYLFSEITNFKIKKRLNISFINESFDIGKWSLFNMVIQLIITQIILSKLNCFENKNSIIVYGLVLTLTGILNPIISSFNNYIISYIKLKIEISKTNFKKLVLKINAAYIAMLIGLSFLIVLIFPIIESNLIEESFDGLFIVFFFVLISLIFKSDNQYNSRVITLIHSRKIVFLTGVISLVFLGLLLLFSFPNWETWLIFAFLVTRISSSLFSKYILIKKLNV